MGGVEGGDEGSVILHAISIQPQARAEILEGYRYYEDKEQGLGAEFRRAVDVCLSLVIRYPRLYAVVEGDVRRVLLRRFPYGIFYLVEESTVVVIACFHTSRNPEKWNRRIGHSDF